MPFWRTYYHLVWATENRQPYIKPEIEPNLFAYLVKKASELDVYVYAINGWYDHIHLIVSIPPKLSIAEVVKHLKGASSHDLKLDGSLEKEFAWQRGYGVLTTGERQRKDAESYVNHQKAHHQQATVNSWLEHYTDIDEGPAEPGGKVYSSTIREPPAPYESIGEPPF